MTTTERLRRFALQHLLRCGSDTEARRKSERVMEQRCLRCHRVRNIPVRDDENVDEILLLYAQVQSTGTSARRGQTAR